MARTATAAFALLLALGCAGVGIYKNPDCTEKTAIPFCAPAPHLVVRYTGAKEPRLETQLVMLPDFSRMCYVRPERGWGNANAEIVLENGILKSFQAEGDAQGAETAKAAGEAAGKIATAFTGLYGTLKESAEEQALDVAKIEKLAAELKPIAADLRAMARKAALGAPDTERKKFEDAASLLETFVKELEDPRTAASIEAGAAAKRLAGAFNLVKAVDVARYKDDPVSAKGVAVVRNVLSLLIEELTPPGGEGAFLKIYRIHTDLPGETRLELVHVDLP